MSDTAGWLKREMERNGYLRLEHGGAEYCVSWDEDANGIYMWPWGQGDAEAVDWLGDDYDEAEEAITAMRSEAPANDDRLTGEPLR